MQTRQLIVDTAAKIFGDRCDKALLDAAERGEFADALWQVIVENGFDQLGTDASGTEAGDMYAFIQQCGRFAVPLPIADTLLVNCWAGADGTLGSVGLVARDHIQQIHWGRQAGRVMGVVRGSHDVVLVTRPRVVEQGTSMAGEPMDSVVVQDPETFEVEDDPFAQVALTRINLMAGVLQSLLDLGLQFAAEREQFGRPIGKFQVIQHSLAVVAAEVAAAKRAADAAVDALGDPRFVYEVAAGKARVGEAVGVVAEQVHQIHGAMGFTHEHRLHHFSRRAWSWRDVWGNEFYWQSILGAHLAALGADRVWDFIATRS